MTGRADCLLFTLATVTDAAELSPDLLSGQRGRSHNHADFLDLTGTVTSEHSVVCSLFLFWALMWWFCVYLEGGLIYWDLLHKWRFSLSFSISGVGNISQNSSQCVRGFFFPFISNFSCCYRYITEIDIPILNHWWERGKMMKQALTWL